MGIFQNKHEGQGGQRPNALHLAQDLRLWIVLSGYLFELALILPRMRSVNSPMVSSKGPRADTSSFGRYSATFL